jgi:broad specificity phosphatase PhoE
MKEIVLIRHAETDLAGRFCGHSDPDLNAAGEHRLRSIIEEVAPLGVTRIYSSDLRRASRTATAIHERTGAPVEFRSGLREIHFGLWEGLTWEEVEQKYPTEAQLWVREFPACSAPEGEAYQDFVLRVEAEFKTALAGHENGALAVVSHRGVMQYALIRFFGLTENDARKQAENYGAVVVRSQPVLDAIDYTDIKA